MPLGVAQTRGLMWLRRLYGLTWLYDTWTASSSATHHALAAFLGLSVASVAVHLAGTGVLLVDLYIALALLLGKSMRLVLWVGLVYLLVLWILVEHGGDFDPLAGGTDIGLSPPYILMLIFVCAGWRIRTAQATHGDIAVGHYWIGAVRVMFGFVWAWDAMFKLRPHFLTHFTTYLVVPDAMSGVPARGASMAGMSMARMARQPGWVVAWLHGWVGFIDATSPLAFGIATAVIEVAIAYGLLTGRWLRIVLPLGLIFSLLIWVTAEGFGGPFGNGTTGMPGNMFGTAIIYAFLFAGLMVFYHWPRVVLPAVQSSTH
ncbi:MAG: hypothetical protein ACREPL_11930 [Rhodanobacteraceae bacterium]